MYAFSLDAMLCVLVKPQSYSNNGKNAQCLAD